MPMSLKKSNIKSEIKQILFEMLASEDCFINLPDIVQEARLNFFFFLVCKLTFNNIVLVCL